MLCASVLDKYQGEDATIQHTSGWRVEVEVSHASRLVKLTAKLHELEVI